MQGLNCKIKTPRNGVFVFLVGVGGLARTALCACYAAFVSTQTSQCSFSFTHRRTKQTAFVWPNTTNHITAKIKNDREGRFLFLVGVGGFEPPQS